MKIQIILAALKVGVVAALTASLQSAVAQSANNYKLSWSTCDGGGGTSAGGAFMVSGTIGQSDVGMLGSGPYTVVGGFWASPISRNNNPATDSDGDGIPDEWERNYGMNPGDPDDATADSDRDGKTNWEEYIANTNPLDPRSNLVLAVAPVSGVSPSPIISWIADPERRYRIEIRDLLGPNTPWVDSGFGIIQPASGVGPSPMRAEFGVGPSPMYRLFGVGPSPMMEVSGVGPSPMRIFRIQVMLPSAGQ